MKYLHNRRTMIILTLAVAAASAVEMGILFVPDGDPTRVYDGTDTRVFALLIGAALAMALPATRPSPRSPPTPGDSSTPWEGSPCWASFSCSGSTSQYDSFLYEGGMVLLAVLTAMLIAVTIHPDSHLQMILGWEPLRWVGERSLRDLSVALPGHRRSPPRSTPRRA